MYPEGGAKREVVKLTSPSLSWPEDGKGGGLETIFRESLEQCCPTSAFFCPLASSPPSMSEKKEFHFRKGVLLKLHASATV